MEIPNFAESSLSVGGTPLNPDIDTIIASVRRWCGVISVTGFRPRRFALAGARFGVATWTSLAAEQYIAQFFLVNRKLCRYRPSLHPLEKPAATVVERYDTVTGLVAPQHAEHGAPPFGAVCGRS